VAIFARTNFINSIHNVHYEKAPAWFKSAETSGLAAWVDKNGDGRIQYGPGDAIEGKPKQIGHVGAFGQQTVKNSPTDNSNEVYIDRDIIVLANPEIAQLPNWVIALVAAGALAAAMSTAAGLLLVIASAISHDLLKGILMPSMSEKGELLWARCGAAGAVVVAGLFGIFPLGYVAQVVAFAFGLAASTFFPVILMGIFSKRVNVYGAVSGMLGGVLFTTAYIGYFTLFNPERNTAEHWLFGISPEGIGAVGMLINFILLIVVSRFTPPPPQEVQHQVENLRYPVDRDRGETRIASKTRRVY